MSYHVHKTPGLVLQVTPRGESNVFIVIFTRELGLIKATAQGVRHLKSKLRYGIQKYNVSQFSFVYGKNVWRLTNAVPKYSTYYNLKKDKGAITIVGNTCSLLQRLLTGEEKNSELFDLVINGISFLENSKLSEKDMEHFEFLFVLRILYNLGYISGSAGLELLALGSVWNDNTLEDVSSYRKEAVTVINRAILESQL